MPSQGEVHKHSSSPCTVRSLVKRLGVVLEVPSMTKLGELEMASSESSVPKRKEELSSQSSRGGGCHRHFIVLLTLLDSNSSHDAPMHAINNLG